jgi:hypothetical protein
MSFDFDLWFARAGIGQVARRGTVDLQENSIAGGEYAVD